MVHTGNSKSSHKEPLKPLSHIKNKEKRFEVHRRRIDEKRKVQSTARLERKKAQQELGVPLPVPKTIESKRLRTEDDVENGDEELAGDEQDDEFAPFWKCEKEPKIFLTTRPRPSKHLFKFISDLMGMIPLVFYHPRKSRELTEMSAWALDNGFTHMIVLGEKNKAVTRLTLSLLDKEGGPTCVFKVSSVELQKDLKDHGTATDHLPELVLNNFDTRTGHRVGRMFGSMFPQRPEFLGRTVVTFHNQRDFIFVRHHRYEFTPSMQRANLQELGPRFTLKMRSMSAGGGAADRKHGEVEFSRQRGEEKVKKGTKDGREFVL